MNISLNGSYVGGIEAALDGEHVVVDLAGERGVLCVMANRLVLYWTPSDMRFAQRVWKLLYDLAFDNNLELHTDDLGHYTAEPPGPSFATHRKYEPGPQDR